MPRQQAILGIFHEMRKNLITSIKNFVTFQIKCKKKKILAKDLRHIFRKTLFELLLSKKKKSIFIYLFIIQLSLIYLLTRRIIRLFLFYIFIG